MHVLCKFNDILNATGKYNLQTKSKNSNAQFSSSHRSTLPYVKSRLVRKSVFRVGSQVIMASACSPTETSYNIEMLHVSQIR